jgi:hypothetical protein
MTEAVRKAGDALFESRKQLLGISHTLNAVHAATGNAANPDGVIREANQALETEFVEACASYVDALRRYREISRSF